MRNADMPAIPVKPEVIQGNHQVHLGLTKREHLAAIAMQGLLASGPHDCDEHGVAHDALLHADALLTALEKDND